MERQKQELNPTLKVKPVEDGENAVQLKEPMQVSITSVKDIATTHGTKTIASVEAGQEKYNVFINATSMNNLIEAFGNDDKYWIGKFCNLEVENAPAPFNKNNMIVFKPIA